MLLQDNLKFKIWDIPFGEEKIKFLASNGKGWDRALTNGG
jgi:hypothetical protein